MDPLSPENKPHHPDGHEDADDVDRDGFLLV
jgi:hypothetical protein